MRFTGNVGFTGLLAFAAVAGIVACAATRDGSTGTKASGVIPEIEEGNPTCEDLGLTTLIKIEAGSLIGEHAVVGGSITISTDGTTLDFTSTVGIDAVLVKGGPAANFYAFVNAMVGSGLVSPLNPGGNVPAISHVDFCTDGEEPDAGGSSSGGSSSGGSSSGGSSSGGSSSGGSSSGATW